MSIAVGDTLGPYKISARLGGGGMGEIWKARDTRLGRDVAIKTSQQRFSERFEREAEALSKLNHPHICQIYDVGPDYIVMELIDGKPLRGPLPIDTALDYASQICAALDAAHSSGIVHRDLKPENILLTRHGVKLLDFGLAKVQDDPAAVQIGDRTLTAKLTGVGQIVGTLCYMSPEQLQAKTVDARSDIFGLGLVLYEIVTGRRAFDGDNPASVVAAILRGEPRPLVELQPTAPAGLSRVLKVCLAKDPEGRWQSARDLQRELNWLREAPAAPADLHGGFAWKQALMGAAIVASLATGVWMWNRTRLPDLPSWRITPLTSYAGNEEMPAISPDGNQVAFVWNGERQDNLDIYVKQIGDDAPPLRITRDEAVDFAPCWSPDGKRLAFLRRRLNGSELVVSSSLGGGERIVANLSYSPSLSISVYSSISWSPDGRFIAALDRSRIVRVNVETREVHPLTDQLPAGISDLMPSYAPDGSALAFTRGLDLVGRKIWIQKLDRRGDPNGSPTLLTKDSDSFLGVTWMPERRSLLTSKGFPGSFQQMVRVPLDGGVPHEVPVDTIAVWFPSYNPIRHRLAYQRRWMDLDILRFSLDKPNEAPTPVIASTHLDFALDVSPDGKRLVFESTRDGRPGIWRAERDGTNQILLAAAAFGSPRWSPDGKWVVFDGKHRGESSIYVVSADGGAPRQFSGTTSKDNRPSVSPDGKWVYFNSPVSGHQDIWREPWAGGTPTQVTRDGGSQALPSADGKWVYYSRSGGVWRVPPDGGRETKILDDITTGYWALAGDLVYYLRRNGEQSSVVEYEPSSGRSRVAYRFPFTLEPAYPNSAIGVSLATKDVFVVHRVRLESDLVLVENFR
jgi:serine/threonine protein kinase